MDVMEAARKRDFSSQRVALALSPLPPLASSKFQVLMMAFSLLFFLHSLFPRVQKHHHFRPTVADKHKQLVLPSFFSSNFPDEIHLL